jgi:hypothetical protein
VCAVDELNQSKRAYSLEVLTRGRTWKFVCSSVETGGFADSLNACHLAPRPLSALGGQCCLDFFVGNYLHALAVEPTISSFQISRALGA